MPEAIDSQGNEVHRPAGQSNAEDSGMPSITAELEKMVSLVAEYTLNAIFFNEIIGPILLEAEAAWPLIDTNQGLSSALTTNLGNLDRRMNALYGRVGLEIPAHLQGVISTQGAATEGQTSNQSQDNTSGLDQG